MCWLPWAALPARSNLTTQELIDWLRDRAIEFNAPPQFVNALDALQSEIDSGVSLGVLSDIREDLLTAETSPTLAGVLAGLTIARQTLDDLVD